MGCSQSTMYNSMKQAYHNAPGMHETISHMFKCPNKQMVSKRAEIIEALRKKGRGNSHEKYSTLSQSWYNNMRKMHKAN
eukprot:scaffold4870_cov75-Skeletonema_dohrnii-CCMP3373.AAC.3